MNVKNEHFLPLVSVLVISALGVAASQVNFEFDSLEVAILVIGAILLNIFHSVKKKTFRPHMVVELVLVGLIAYITIISFA